MILIYITIAALIAWAWIDYFRMIDVFETEKIFTLIVTFVLGGCSVLLVYAINDILNYFVYFELNGELVNDFFFSFLKIGMVEEFSKLVPFLVVLLIFRKQINESIDYIIYISIAALGFSAVENVMYFNYYGSQLIISRSVLCSMSHMFDTALIAYGIILVKFRNSKFAVFKILLFFILASLSHGFYDFWLIFEGIRGGWLVTLLYFLFTVSFFATILNNALNCSSFFSEKILINSGKIIGRMLLYYALIFLAQFILLIFSEGIQNAFWNLVVSIYTSGFIILVTVVRLSRFKLLSGRWERLKIELPFSLSPGNNTSDPSSRLHISIKGDSPGESRLTILLKEFVTLLPYTKNVSPIKEKTAAFIEEKRYDKNGQVYYIVRVYPDGPESGFKYVLLKPKAFGKSLVKKKYPIVALLYYRGTQNPEFKNDFADSKFVGWVVIKP